MQTKSRLGRIAAGVAVALAIPALFIFVMIHHGRSTSRAAAASPATVAARKTTPANFDWTNYGKLPLAFQVNQGQTASDVHFLSRGDGYALYLTGQEAVLTLRQPAAQAAAPRDRSKSGKLHHNGRVAERLSVVRMRLDGANPNVAIAGVERIPTKVNYFIGNDPKKWHTDVPVYSQVKYQAVYPGVDLLFYGNQRRLEYDFLVAPGADAKAIALDVQGASRLQLDRHGNLLMKVAGGEVELQKPVIYQEVNGARREIAGNYAIANDHQIRFAIAGYDPTEPLTIDPILNYATYVGGENFDNAFGIALDAAGDAYIAGATSSTMFPQMNAEAGTPGDLSLGTVFVTELNPDGTAILYSTYLGGSGNGSFGEGADAIAVDTASPTNVYVTGYTGSPDFPVSTAVPPFQGTAPASAATGGAAFITKLTPSLTGTAQLAYSSYLGGDTFDEGHSIAVDGSGDAFIAGETISTNYPTKGTQITAGQTSGAGNAFLTEINTTSTGALIYSTYLGGSGAGSAFLGYGDVAYGIAIDASSHAYVVGGTTSTDFPTAGTAIPGSAACGVNPNGSAFISVIDTTAGTLGYSHCLSGNNADVAFGVSLGTGVPAVATQVAYITGETASSNFPVTANSIPPAGGVTNGVAFVSLVNTNSATPLQYSTFLGGTGTDLGYSIASDALGNAYVTGATASLDFPITQGALQEHRNNPSGTVFVAKITPNGHALADLAYSTYFGGQAVNTLVNADLGLGIAVSGTNAYVTGQMAAPDMLVSPGAFQSSLGAAGATANAFVADLPLVASITYTPTSINFGTQLVGSPTAAQLVTLTNNTSSAITLTPPALSFTGANPGDFSVDPLTTTCTASLPASPATCTYGLIFTPSINGAESATFNVFDGADTVVAPDSGRAHWKWQQHGGGHRV